MTATTDRPTSPMHAPDEIGTTVADTRRLARKATRIFIHFYVGPDKWSNDCIGMTRAAFLRSIAGKPDTDPMSSILRTPDGNDFSDCRWLQIGCRW